MTRITLELSDEAVLALQRSGESVEDALRLAAAMKLFEMGRLSSGAAAAVAGIPRTVFLSKLTEFRIDTFRETEDELSKDSRLG